VRFVFTLPAWQVVEQIRIYLHDQMKEQKTTEHQAIERFRQCLTDANMVRVWKGGAQEQDGATRIEPRHLYIACRAHHIPLPPPPHNGGDGMNDAGGGSTPTHDGRIREDNNKIE